MEDLELLSFNIISAVVPQSHVMYRQCILLRRVILMKLAQKSKKEKKAL